MSPNGWTDGELAEKWIIEDFDRQTRDKVNGETHVLILDGHSSHHTEKLLNFPLANNIIILGYPPHCTHATSGYPMCPSVRSNIFSLWLLLTEGVT